MIKEYKIITNKGAIFYIKGRSPKEALTKLYKGYYIEVKVSEKESADHKIKLLNGKISSTMYYNVYIKELQRKAKPVNYIEPIPKKQLQKLIKKFRAEGGVILTGEDVEKHLEKTKAEACTLSADIILIGKNPSRSAVYEELIHAEQYRQGKIDGTIESRLICEIEAQEILIRNKEEYGITDIEDKQTRAALKAYKEEYRKLKRKG